MWALRLHRRGGLATFPLTLSTPLRFSSDISTLQHLSKAFDQDASAAADKLAADLVSNLSPAQVVLLQGALSSQIKPEQNDDAYYDGLWEAFAAKGQMTE